MGELQQIVCVEDIEIQKHLLFSYLKKWYNKHNECGWHDSHKSKQNLYYGYWSFEAGATAKILGIDDSDIRNCKYYPYDLVHY